MTAEPETVPGARRGTVGDWGLADTVDVVAELYRYSSATVRAGSSKLLIRRWKLCCWSVSRKPTLRSGSGYLAAVCGLARTKV